jgi:hypothetical protein
MRNNTRAAPLVPIWRKVGRRLHSGSGASPATGDDPAASARLPSAVCRTQLQSPLRRGSPDAARRAGRRCRRRRSAIGSWPGPGPSPRPSDDQDHVPGTGPCATYRCLPRLRAPCRTTGCRPPVGAGEWRVQRSSGRLRGVRDRNPRGVGRPIPPARAAGPVPFARPAGDLTTPASAVSPLTTRVGVVRPRAARSPTATHHRVRGAGTQPGRLQDPDRTKNGSRAPLKVVLGAGDEGEWRR